MDNKFDRRLKLVKIFAITLAVLALASLVVFVVFWAINGSDNMTKEEKQHKEKVLNTPLYEMTPEIAKDRLKYETGKDAEQWSQSKVSDDSFKDFDSAFNTASMLAINGYIDKSLEAYKIADKKANPDQRTPLFYEGFLAVALSMEDAEMIKEVSAKYKKSVEDSDSMSDEDKKSLIDSIEESIKLNE